MIVIVCTIVYNTGFFGGYQVHNDTFRTTSFAACGRAANDYKNASADFRRYDLDNGRDRSNAEDVCGKELADCPLRTGDADGVQR